MDGEVIKTIEFMENPLSIGHLFLNFIYSSELVPPVVKICLYTSSASSLIFILDPHLPML